MSSGSKPPRSGERITMRFWSGLAFCSAEYPSMAPMVPTRSASERLKTMKSRVFTLSPHKQRKQRCDCGHVEKNHGDEAVHRPARIRGEELARDLGGDVDAEEQRAEHHQDLEIGREPGEERLPGETRGAKEVPSLVPGVGNHREDVRTVREEDAEAERYPCHHAQGNQGVGIRDKEALQRGLRLACLLAQHTRDGAHQPEDAWEHEKGPEQEGSGVHGPGLPGEHVRTVLDEAPGDRKS